MENRLHLGVGHQLPQRSELLEGQRIHDHCFLGGGGLQELQDGLVRALTLELGVQSKAAVFVSSAAEGFEVADAGNNLHVLNRDGREGGP